MKTREQHLEEQIERIDQSRDQYSKELNIVADLIKERDKLTMELHRINLNIDNCHHKDRIKTEEINILVKENRYLRAELERVSKSADQMRAALEHIRAYPIHSEPMGAAMDMQDIAFKALQSPPEPPASTSGTFAASETGPAPCVSGLPACDTSSNTPSGLTTVPDIGACTSGDELLAIEALSHTFRNVRVLYESQQDACAATPPTGGMPDNGGALQA